MRVQVLERPRIASTSTSSASSRAAAAGWRAFQRSKPARASASRRAFAIVTSGCVERRRPVGDSAPGFLFLDGATRAGSPSCFL